MLLQTTIPNLFLGSVFFAGLLSFFSPCIFPVLPVYIGNLIGDISDKDTLKLGNFKLHYLPILKTLAFILGLSTVFILLGYGTGSFSKMIASPYTNFILGSIIILLGIHQMEVINFTYLQRQKMLSFKKKSGVSGAFLLGLTFSFAWTPCIGPILSAILVLIASSEGSGVYGMLLMLTYSLGLAIPFLLLSLTPSLLVKSFEKVKPHLFFLKRLGGLLIIVMGFLLMTGHLKFINQYLNSFY